MSKLSTWQTLFFLCVFTAATAVGSLAQNFSLLYSFGYGGPILPFGGLVQGNDGNLYGTTLHGTFGDYCPDPYGCGTVFKITPSGTFTIVYSFCSQTNCADGADPIAGLVLASDGNFYGATTGTVFKITPGGVLTTLYTLQGSDGDNPRAPLLQASDGNFYGTTSEGGTSGYGTIFKIAANGTFTTLHSFNGADGAAANALIQASDGNLYGTTSAGGGGGAGTIFKITTGGMLTTLYTFCSQPGCTDGGSPGGGPFPVELVQASDGNFYGTTYSNGAHGGGTVFKFAPGGVLTTLYSFCAEANCTDGQSPVGLLQASDGNFYGVTVFGGDIYNPTLACASGGCGTIFKITPQGTLTTLYTFDGPNAGQANGLMQATNGNFYGTTNDGGADNLGTVFSLALMASASVSPSSLIFGNQSDGTTSAPQPVTLRNMGAGALVIASIAASANFGETNHCGGSVASGGSCTIEVTFDPTASGPLSGTLTITDNTAGVTGSVQTVKLSGTSTTAAAGISPASLKFRPEIVGRTSKPQPVTLTNAGSGTLMITSIATSAHFGETNTCGGAVAPGGSCTIHVTFKPRADGNITGTLTVTDNNHGVEGSQQTVMLSGTGIAGKQHHEHGEEGEDHDHDDR